MMKNRVILLLVLTLFINCAAIVAEDPNLIGWWKFDDTSAAEAIDSSGNGNHGILQGDAVKSTWAYDKALMLYDDGDYVEVGHDPVFNVTNKLTLMAWVRISSSQRNMKIISKGLAFDFGRDYDNNNLIFICNGLGRPVRSTKGVFDYKWHHLVAVYNGSALSIYVDGVLSGTKAASGNIAANDANILIGDYSEISNGQWCGNIDDVRIYNRVLSADEIKLFYYPFDINGDKIVDMYDLEILADKWLGDGGASTADTNGDGVVNFKDYREVANNFDERVPPEEAKWKSLATVERGIPEPLEGNPGNIYLEGDEVTVVVLSAAVSAVSWQFIDDANQVVAAGNMPDVSVQGLGIGWYWVSFRNASDQEITHSTAAVLAKLKAPVPQDSPVCIDMASAWFYNSTAEWQQYANFATLAGINIIRDRLTWEELEPTKGNFITTYTKYDETADIQTEAGLKVLQVFHRKPSWSPISGEGFPTDLRDLYKFCKEMAIRFKGRIHAWEPWNEANASNFGNMTIDEMSCLQKAAYLGFKAGDPDVIVGWNAYGGIPCDLHTIGVLKNEAWSYFDTYNAHTYEPPVSYNGQWGVLLEAACGKPIWITESNRFMDGQTGSPWYDFDYYHEVLRANFMAQSYASAIYAGAIRHFHFILGYFGDGTPLGLLRLDNTPKAQYAALAAVGRFMAGAKSVGRRYEADRTEPCHLYCFHAKPDGVESDLIVAWAERYSEGANWGKTTEDWPLTQQLEVKAVYDYLGRYLGTKIPAQITGKPTFIILKPGELDKLDLEKQKRFAERAYKPYNVMLQLKMPRSLSIQGGPRWRHVPEHVIKPNIPRAIDIWAYNFSDTAVTGQVVTEELAPGFSLTPGIWNINIPPMGRVQLPATATIPANPDRAKNGQNWFNLKGDFGDDGKPVLSFRLLDHWEIY